MGGKKQGQFACDFLPWGKAVSFVASSLLSPHCDYLNLCYFL